MNKFILFSITILLSSFQFKNESSHFPENNVKVVNHLDAHAQSVQFRSITQKGTQCKNQTNNQWLLSEASKSISTQFRTIKIELQSAMFGNNPIRESM